MKIELKIASPDLVEMLPKWAEKEELKEYFRSWPALADWNRQDLIVQRLDWSYGIYKDGQLVGMFQLYYPNHIARTVEYGGLVDKDLCDNRFEVSDVAHDLLLEMLFTKQNFRKVLIRVLDHREKLIKRYQDVGYKVEGTLRESCMFEGTYRNEVLLGFIKGN